MTEVIGHLDDQFCELVCDFVEYQEKLLLEKEVS